MCELDYAKFVAQYPEFDCRDESVIRSVALQVDALHNCFCSLASDKVREQAVFLAIAHYLTLRTNPMFVGGQVKEIKNRNDSISYAVADSNDSYGWNSTLYGSQLSKLLRLRSFGGFVSVG